MTQQIILLRGLPGSGKTTWALQEVAAHPDTYKRINKDSLRAMFDGTCGYSFEREVFILDVRETLIGMALERGFSVIIDDTNFGEHHEQRIRYSFEDRAQITVKDFTDVPLEECIRRDAGRDKPVGEEVIRNMYQKYLAPKEEEKQ